jgi:hypothetical protein
MSMTNAEHQRRWREKRNMLAKMAQSMPAPITQVTYALPPHLVAQRDRFVAVSPRQEYEMLDGKPEGGAAYAAHTKQTYLGFDRVQWLDAGSEDGHCVLPTNREGIPDAALLELGGMTETVGRWRQEILADGHYGIDKEMAPPPHWGCDIIAQWEILYPEAAAEALRKAAEPIEPTAKTGKRGKRRRTIALFAAP